MSNIPFNTISSVLASTGLSQQVGSTRARETQEATRAQRIQQLKTAQHSETIEDFDDTAVEATKDQPQHKNPQQRDDHPPEQSDEKENLLLEQIDISTLKNIPQKSPATPSKNISRLDISA